MIRPLEVLPVPTFPDGIDTAGIITSIPATPEYNELLLYFTDYPVNSYMSNNCRALIYAMVRVLKPRQLIEIGTMFAGTSELFARAMWENQQGTFRTIDPYGGHRIPGMLQNWPEELRNLTEFSPISSMQLFMELADKPDKPDFIFIDGNHDYEYALFDLMCCARIVKPGGIIFMDNYCDPGVNAAAQRFCSDNPDWQDINFSGHRSFGTNIEHVILDNLYKIFIVPETFAIGTQPKAFQSGPSFDADGLNGFTLNLAKPAPAGRLHYKAYVRTFPWELHLGKGGIDEDKCSGAMEIEAGARTAKVKLPIPLVSPRTREGFSRRYELNLLFESEPSGKPLTLSQAPLPDFFER